LAIEDCQHFGRGFRYLENEFFWGKSFKVFLLFDVERSSAGKISSHRLVDLVLNFNSWVRQQGFN